MRTLVFSVRRVLYSPLYVLRWVGAPLFVAQAVLRVLVRFDRPLRRYLLGRWTRPGGVCKAALSPKWGICQTILFWKTRLFHGPQV